MNQRPTRAVVAHTRMRSFCISLVLLIAGCDRRVATSEPRPTTQSPPPTPAAMPTPAATPTPAAAPTPPPPSAPPTQAAPPLDVARVSDAGGHRPPAAQLPADPSFPCVGPQPPGKESCRRSPARWDIGKPRVIGLARTAYTDQIAQLASRHVQNLRGCYMNAHMHQPTLSGSLDLEFTVEPQDAISHVEAKSQIAAAADLCACIEGGLPRLKLQLSLDPSKPPVRLHYQIRFAPPPPGRWVHSEPLDPGFGGRTR